MPHRSHSPACAGLIPARALSGSRAAAEHGDPELRSFSRILRRRRNISRFYFYVRSWRFVLLLLLLLRSRLVAERYLFDLSGIAVATASSRLSPFAGHLRPLRPPRSCLLRYPTCRSDTSTSYTVQAAARENSTKKTRHNSYFRFNSIILNTASSTRSKYPVHNPGRNCCESSRHDEQY